MPQTNTARLIAADGAAAAALWADLLTRDLIGEVTARMRPVDDPLLDMLADRRRARAYLSDGLWIRLVDVPAALTSRRYSCPADMVIEVTDDLLPANAGRWRLQCPGPGETGTATCERTTAAADILLPVAALGAGYLGGVRLGALGTAGLITDQAARRALSSNFLATRSYFTRPGPPRPSRGPADANAPPRACTPADQTGHYKRSRTATRLCRGPDHPPAPAVSPPPRSQVEEETSDDHGI